MSDELRRRYRELAHAVQTGVATEHGLGSSDGTPKHLRVGVNLAMADHGSLVRLLIARGLFTEEEYLAALVDGLEREVAAYEAVLLEKTGHKVVLR